MAEAEDRIADLRGAVQRQRRQVEAGDAVRGAQAVLGPAAALEDLVRAALKKGA